MSRSLMLVQSARTHSSGETIAANMRESIFALTMLWPLCSCHLPLCDKNMPGIWDDHFGRAVESGAAVVVGEVC
jgi:hypothetical protein